MDKIEANQGLPYKLIKNRFFHNQQYKDLLYIVNKNIPGIKSDEVIEMFKNLNTTGCSCAMLANSLVDQIYKNDEDFKNVFGFSCLTKGKIDCNKLMVDIFSKLYKIMKIKFVEYQNYKFNSLKEAQESLLGSKYIDDSSATLDLFNNGFVANGTLNNQLLFKSKIPTVTEYVGDVGKIAKEKFGIDWINSIDQLKKLCTNKNIEMECKDVNIYEKLTGLGTNNFNFWSNYYLSQYNINIGLVNEQISVRDFNNDYKSFMDYINNLNVSGYSISISSPPNGEAYMHTKKSLSWSKISIHNAGHIMLFKRFDENQDIIVSSYGEEYIIPKEYFNVLEFRKIKTIDQDSKEKSR